MAIFERIKTPTPFLGKLTVLFRRNGRGGTISQYPKKRLIKKNSRLKKIRAHF